MSIPPSGARVLEYSSPARAVWMVRQRTLLIRAGKIQVLNVPHKQQAWTLLRLAIGDALFTERHPGAWQADGWCG